MVRITRGNVANKRRKKYLKLAKGYCGVNSRLSTFATEQIIQSLNVSYVGRKLKKRNFRRICLLKILTLLNQLKFSYYKMCYLLKKNNIFFNKKILSLLFMKKLPILKHFFN